MLNKDNKPLANADGGNVRHSLVFDGDRRGRILVEPRDCGMLCTSFRDKVFEARLVLLHDVSRARDVDLLRKRDSDKRVTKSDRCSHNAQCEHEIGDEDGLGKHCEPDRDRGRKKKTVKKDDVEHSSSHF